MFFPNYTFHPCKSEPENFPGKLFPTNRKVNNVINNRSAMYEIKFRSSIFYNYFRIWFGHRRVKSQSQTLDKRKLRIVSPGSTTFFFPPSRRLLPNRRDSNKVGEGSRPKDILHETHTSGKGTRSPGLATGIVPESCRSSELVYLTTSH